MAVFGNIEKELNSFLFIFRIEVASRFVGDEELWFDGESSAESDPLPLSLGELLREPVPVLIYSGFLSNLLCLFGYTLDFLRSEFGKFKRKENVLSDSQVFDEGKVLKDEPDF